MRGSQAPPHTAFLTSLQLADMAPPNAPVVYAGNVPGVFVRGTLRMPREQLFDAIQANLKQAFGECLNSLTCCSMLSIDAIFILAGVWHL